MSHALPVETLGLNVRATNVLRRRNIHTIGELLCTPDSTLLESWSCGVNTLEHIHERLAKCGWRCSVSEKVFATKKTDPLVAPHVVEMFNPIWFFPIEELQLTPRASNALLRNKIETVAGLVRLNERDLRALPFCGPVCADEIKSALRKFVRLHVMPFDEAVNEPELPPRPLRTKPIDRELRAAVIEQFRVLYPNGVRIRHEPDLVQSFERALPQLTEYSIAPGYLRHLICDSPHVYLWDKGLYIHEDHLRVDERAVDTAISFCLDRFDAGWLAVTVDRIFLDNMHFYVQAGIPNGRALYLLLQKRRHERLHSDHYPMIYKNPRK